MGLLEQLTYDPQMALGMGLLGASGPSRMPVSLGQGLAQGWGNMQEVAKEKQKSDLIKLQSEMQKMQMDQLKKSLATKEMLGRALMGGQPQTAPQSSAPYGGGYSPDVAKAFGVPSGVPTQPQSQPQVSYADKLLAAAQASGDVDAFQEAMKMKMEEKRLAPKFASDVRVVMKNGVPTAIQMADDGTVKEMSGYSPAEKLHFADNGQFTGIGIDPYSGKPVSQGLKKQMTDAEKASNALGWANYGKPSIHNVEGVGMLAVGPNGIANPVTANGKPVVQDKPLNEFQGKAATFADMMASAERIMADPKLADNQKPEKLATAVKAIPSFGVGGAVGNQIESTNRQVVRQAQETWVRAALRKESGAVIGPEEMAQEIRTFFPQIGDSPEVISQKAQLRKLKQQGIAREAGSGYKPGGMSVGQSTSGVIDFSQLRK